MALGGQGQRLTVKRGPSPKTLNQEVCNVQHFPALLKRPRDTASEDLRMPQYFPIGAGGSSARSQPVIEKRWPWHQGTTALTE